MEHRSPFDADPIQLAAEAARGRRPEFIDDPLVDRLFGIVLSLTVELAATRERLDTVERALARREVLPREDIEAFRPSADEGEERGRMQQEYLARVFRVLLQDVPAEDQRLRRTRTERPDSTASR